MSTDKDFMFFLERHLKETLDSKTLDKCMYSIGYYHHCLELDTFQKRAKTLYAKSFSEAVCFLLTCWELKTSTDIVDARTIEGAFLACLMLNEGDGYNSINPNSLAKIATDSKTLKLEEALNNNSIYRGEKSYQFKDVKEIIDAVAALSADTDIHNIILHEESLFFSVDFSGLAMMSSPLKNRFYRIFKDSHTAWETRHKYEWGARHKYDKIRPEKDYLRNYRWFTDPAIKGVVLSALIISYAMIASEIEQSLVKEVVLKMAEDFKKDNLTEIASNIFSYVESRIEL